MNDDQLENTREQYAKGYAVYLRWLLWVFERYFIRTSTREENEHDD